jgi:hypothetical protein
MNGIAWPSHGIASRRKATQKGRSRKSAQRATDNLQPAMYNVQPATHNVQHGGARASHRFFAFSYNPLSLDTVTG